MHELLFLIAYAAASSLRFFTNEGSKYLVTQRSEIILAPQLYPSANKLLSLLFECSPDVSNYFQFNAK